MNNEIINSFITHLKRNALFWGLITFGILINLPFGLSWLLCFWALGHVIFERKEGDVPGANAAANWFEIICLAVLPSGIFWLHEAAPLEINRIFWQHTSSGQQVEWFPGVYYGVLYLVPFLRRIAGRREVLSCLQFRLTRRHVLLIVLSIIPIIVTNIKQASSNAQYFASVSEAALFVAAVKPFYFNGLWEELYFRGLLFSLLLTRLRVGLAVVISAVIFALSHYDLIKAVAVIDFYQFLTQLFIVFALGLATASVCWRSGSLWPAIVFHSCTSGFAYLTALIARNW